MGTRNLTMVKLGEKIHGQYGQWDGYPSGNGLAILDFLQDRFDEEVFKAHFQAAEFLTDIQVESAYARLSKEGVDDNKNPFDRDMGAGILAYLQETEKPEIYNNIAFAADSLFCEWAYMVDLDERKLRIFEGFNKSPLADGQFFKENAKLLTGSGVGGPDYHPIKEIASLTFDEVAIISGGEFLATCKKNSRHPDED